MKKPDFALYVTKFLTDHLAGTRNLSSNTIISYRDTITQLILFMNTRFSIAPEKLRVSDFNEEVIRSFLDELEDERNCCISTRNQRLAAIHSLFRYISLQNPEYMFAAQQILNVPAKKAGQKTVKHLEQSQMKELLAAPSGDTPRGRRDRALLCLLYDSGCRVQELADLRVLDLRLTDPAQVRLTGKGRKVRNVPLTDETKQILEIYLEENKLNSPQQREHPLFFNCHETKLTRQGITYVLQKYTTEVGLEGITPHCMRHSKAMHLTEADINPVYIRDFLGHSNLKTTQIYSKTSVELKRRALEKLKGEDTIPRSEADAKDWTGDEDLMNWLSQLGH